MTIASKESNRVDRRAALTEQVLEAQQHLLHCLRLPQTHDFLEVDLTMQQFKTVMLLGALGSATAGQLAGELNSGLSAVDTGVLLLPQGLSAGFSGPIAGRLTDRFGSRWIVMFGFVLLAINTYQLTQITLTTSFGWLRVLLALRGLALGCALQPTQLTAMAAVPPGLNTAASSLNNAMRNIFQSFGIAALSTLVQSQSAVHTVTLSWQVRADTYQGLALTQLAGYLQQQGLSATAAGSASLALLFGAIRQQASVLAFGDAYRVTFYAALGAICLASLLPGRSFTRHPGDGAAAMAH